MKDFFRNYKEFILLGIFSGLFLSAVLFFPYPFRNHFVNNYVPNVVFATSTPEIEVFVPSYVETPDQVKGIYITSWVAGTPYLRAPLIKMVEDTELNSVIIDIKDYTGKVVFPINSPNLKAFGSEEVRIKDLQDFIEELHQKGIYVIGRVAVFQDVYFVKYRPDLAVKNKVGDKVWRDRKGISWVDPASKEYWDYIILISEESRKIGFDEINFDYIRFPSDGDMKDISYPFSSTTPKTEILKNFFMYLDEKLATSGLKTSADVFGMVTSVTDDMGIGQILENTLPYFDYVSPMVYPSHYPEGYLGYKSPENNPYDIVKLEMQAAVNRSELLASTTGKTLAELRPWLQDFGLKTTYTSKEVRDQIQATYDVGLNSWMLWSASNKYTKGGSLEETEI